MKRDEIKAAYNKRMLERYPVFDTMPEGWRAIKNAVYHPTGYMWICNGKSRFSKEWKQGLLKCAE